MFAAVSEKVANRNVAHFFNRGDSNSSEETADAFQQLQALLRVTHIESKRWAALAFTQIASFDTIVDPFVNRRPKLDSSKTKGEEDKPKTASGEGAKPSGATSTISSKSAPKEMPPGRDLLYNQSGLVTASQLAYDADPVIRRAGAVAMARFVQYKDASSDMFADNSWKSLLSVCKATCVMANTLDIDGEE
jgi:hypothetical protein